jgi:hypothetical protein
VGSKAGLGVFKVKLKGKVYRIAGHENPKGEWRYTCTVSLSGCWMEVCS